MYTPSQRTTTLCQRASNIDQRPASNIDQGVADHPSAAEGVCRERRYRGIVDASIVPWQKDRIYLATARHGWMARWKLHRDRRL